MIPGRLKSLMLNLVLHPAMLAIPVALFVIWLVPDVFDKFIIAPVYEKPDTTKGFPL